MQAGMTDKPLLRVLHGEALWPPPIWLMRQAGRYLPEYRAARAQVRDLVVAFTSPDLATDITLQPIRRYGMDAAILYSDILILPWALGHGLEFRESVGPIMPKLRDQAGLDALEPAGFADRVAPVIETVRRVTAALRDHHPATALIGFAGAPFTVACYMVEGGGSRDHAEVRGLAYRDPALFARLIDRLTEATIDYLAWQAEAGAEALMLFDSWAGVLPPTLFAAHVTGPAIRIAAALRARCPGIPLIGFPRLAGSQLAAYAAQAGLDAVGMDTATDPVWASTAIDRRIALQGNLDPLLLVAGGEALAAEALALRGALRDRPHIFNLGHGIVPETPPAHVGQLVDLVRSA
jgi:uroporphyrinogen decarboxylase